MDPLQCAYHSNYSTKTIHLHIVSDLLLASNSGKVSPLTLLDLSASFDTVDHSILPSRLKHTFGIHDTALACLSPVCVIGSKQCLLTASNPIL